VRQRPEIKPSVDLPVSAAAEELTGFEMIAIEKRYGKDLSDLSAPKILMGTVWAYRNRDGERASWADVEAMTMRELAGFFEAEPADPDSDVGKE
jgi:hypothetical protein